MTYLTITTDASFCRSTRIGGFAFWIKCNNFTRKHSYYFKENPDNPNDAELKCIANSLAYILAMKKIPKVSKIIINTDSKYSIRAINNPFDEVPVFIKNKLLELMQVCESKEFEIRHVKAHTNSTDSRSFVNDWCDVQAKEWMRKKRRLFYESKNKNKTKRKTKK